MGLRASLKTAYPISAIIFDGRPDPSVSFWCLTNLVVLGNPDMAGLRVLLAQKSTNICCLVSAMVVVENTPKLVICKPLLPSIYISLWFKAWNDLTSYFHLEVRKRVVLHYYSKTVNLVAYNDHTTNMKR